MFSISTHRNVEHCTYYFATHPLTVSTTAVYTTAAYASAPARLLVIYACVYFARACNLTRLHVVLRACILSHTPKGVQLSIPSGRREDAQFAPALPLGNLQGMYVIRELFISWFQLSGHQHSTPTTQRQYSHLKPADNVWGQHGAKSNVS